MRDHAGRFGRYGNCRGCEDMVRRGWPAGSICDACESEAEAAVEARFEYSGRRWAS